MPACGHNFKTFVDKQFLRFLHVQSNQKQKASSDITYEYQFIVLYVQKCTQ